MSSMPGIVLRMEFRWTARESRAEAGKLNFRPGDSENARPTRLTFVVG